MGRGTHDLNTLLHCHLPCYSLHTELLPTYVNQGHPGQSSYTVHEMHALGAVNTQQLHFLLAFKARCWLLACLAFHLHSRWLRKAVLHTLATAGLWLSPACAIYTDCACSGCC
jgi:hypothetical protein